jgi:hypothetical protein
MAAIAATRLRLKELDKAAQIADEGVKKIIEAIEILEDQEEEGRRRKWDDNNVDSGDEKNKEAREEEDEEEQREDNNSTEESTVNDLEEKKLRCMKETIDAYT